MTAFQTAEVERFKGQIVQLAYTQLLLAGPLAEQLPRPWEKYLPHLEGQIASPSKEKETSGELPEGTSWEPCLTFEGRYIAHYPLLDLPSLKY